MGSNTDRDYRIMLSGSPAAAFGRRDIVMRLELQALPEAIGGSANQNKSADNDQTLQH
jgi:hypothetical protein